MMTTRRKKINFADMAEEILEYDISEDLGKSLISESDLRSNLESLFETSLNESLNQAIDNFLYQCKVINSISIYMVKNEGNIYYNKEELQNAADRIIFYSDVKNTFFGRTMSTEESKIVTGIASNFETAVMSTYAQNSRIISHKKDHIVVKINGVNVCVGEGKTPEDCVNFYDWFDKIFDANMSLTEREEYALKLLIRFPLGYHEWLKASQYRKVKALGIPGEYIHFYRTLTSECRFVDPETEKECIHGSTGSTRMHNALDEVFNGSSNLEEFINKLNEFNTTWEVKDTADENVLNNLIDALGQLKENEEK